LPIIAIGGITLHNCQDTIIAGADGVAVISEILGKKQICNATQKLYECIQIAKERVGVKKYELS
jgi:thiamine-phosphate pyrophosphorylase